MLNALIQGALRGRVIVLALAALLLAAGFQVARDLPVEVLPDLTKPTVVTLTEAPGLAPEEVESNVTVPVERALTGVGGLTRLRSNSDVGLSLVYAEFAWGTDIYRARQLVQERLQGARGSLPEGVEPFLTPVASLMGEILLIGVRSANTNIPPRDVRTLADWMIRPRLQSIPGIAEVLSMGGGIRQIHVLPDPMRMQALGISHEELAAAVRQAAGNSTGGFIESGSREIMVRNLAMTVDLQEIASTVVKRLEDRPVRISDVAKVEWGIEPMRGDASVNGTRGVVMSITKAPGFDTVELTRRIESALADLQATLPQGVEALALFRQADFIERAIGNLAEAIRDGAIMVAIVLLIFLLNARTTLITLMAMPLSFAATLLAFRAFGVSVNSMTLGGLAVAIGMVVDDAVVDVENVFRRLRENAALPAPRPRLQVIAEASAEVRHSILYATILIILVFLPLLGLSGLEGRLFAPIAVATIVSMIASFVVSLTVIPALCSFLLRPKPADAEREARLLRGLKWLLHMALQHVALRHPAPLLSGVSLVVIGAFMLYPQMGKDFLPTFREETALISTTAAPGTSLEQMNQICDVIEQELLSVPGVRKVGRRLGRAERGDHVVPVSTSEFDVEFHPDDRRPRTETLAEIRARLQAVPGTFSVVTGPLADRIGHMLSGVSAPLAVKIFGPDLDRLREIGEEIQAVARTIPGFEDSRLDQQATIPQLRIEPRRDKAAAYGITPGELNERLSSLLAGQRLAELRYGQRVIDVVLRLPARWRESPEQIANLPIELHDQDDGLKHVPLSALAEVREAKGPNVIFRESNQRRFAVAIKPSIRDVGSLVPRLQQEVAAKVQLPEGYFISYEGEFQAREAASRRIALLSVVVIAVIAVLLHGYFRTPFFAFQVLLDVPLALTGGLMLTYLLLDNISIATLVGFIAVAGVAARNSIMLLSHYLHLMKHEGESFTAAMVIRGTKERLAPVLMTALSAGVGLIPLAMAADQPGKEILHPVAVVIVGGLVTSTLLGLAVTPTVFFTFGRKAAMKWLSSSAA
ncbi:MAG TPA: efflux RND transporter permease subunit [Methylomirabilota bacterium]|nr:efflux RND transporter permease subunit [Methylomirabilota bacterium]